MVLLKALAMIPVFSWITLSAALWFWTFQKKNKKKNPDAAAKLSIT